MQKLAERVVSVWLTLVVLLLTASVSTAGLLDQRVLDALRRDGDAISSGQAWRPFTSLVVQDGGVPGTVFNLGGLLAVGVLAERRLGRRRWSLAYFLGGFSGEFVGWAGWQPVGAGNSVAVCGLAAALAIVVVAQPPLDAAAAIVSVAWATALLAATLTIAAPIVATVATRLALAHPGDRASRVAVVGCLTAAAVFLLARTDIHGAALTAGAALGILMVKTDLSNSRITTGATRADSST